MNTSNLWGHFNEITDSINSGVKPLNEVLLKTKVVKLSLGIFLLQSVLIALVWSITERSMSPWIIPMSSFLQVGWLWNKVKESWKMSQDNVYNSVSQSDYDLERSQGNGLSNTVTINPPQINVSSNPLINNKNKYHPLWNSSSSTTTTN